MKYKPKGGPYQRKGDAQPLKDVIQELLEAYRLKGKYHEQRLVAAWPEVMGPFIASRTGNIFVKNQTLFVELSSAALKQELAMSKDKLIALLNEKVGAEVVSEVRLL
ncbi:MAG TPA: DUF721 domain-containing protein [Cytophagales bacterium]|nr:DUF721 domain-containing protein [Cytophagales bacterium]HAA21700.1 DUF721 domain-containing protein [Cytophagales bacterium]HAP60592.1 DUF721 domain-containing protein [Cytophagales bacterium]